MQWQNRPHFFAVSAQLMRRMYPANALDNAFDGYRQVGLDGSFFGVSAAAFGL
jgi:hypothetical protein